MCQEVQAFGSVNKRRELVNTKLFSYSTMSIKTAYVLGSELWEENFEDTLRLVKEFIVDV